MFRASKTKSFLRRFAKDETASATIEFVILVPMVMWVVFSVLEAGWLATQQSMLNRGLNLTIRDLRLGITPNPSKNDIKQSICDYAGILRNCMSSISLELVTLGNPIGGNAARCIDRAPGAVQPNIVFNPGSHVNQEIMVARVCYVVDPLIPGAGLGAALPKDPTGGYHMVSFAAFVNEPAGT